MNPGTRKLAAIMFADMVGYTALMQENETRAKRNRDRHRGVLEKCITDHDGEIVQYYGDGTLSIFGSAVEAVACALDIQQQMQDDPVIPVRIGIHLGDIVRDDEGVYGDGVNITARIEALCKPGAVLISDKVRYELSNHPDFTVRSQGQKSLKNVSQPVEVFSVVSGTDPQIAPTPDIPGDDGGKQTIAVLPFVNMSNDPDNEYFSDGITEEILNALTKVDGLLVTARTSSFAFKGQNLDVRQIGSQLGAGAVLEGSVRKAGNRVRITAQLIQASDGYHLWAETYDRELEDIFEIQDEISVKIADTLQEKLGLRRESVEEIDERVIKAPTDNLEAYRLFLQGRYHLNKWTTEDIRKAMAFFEQAIEEQPDYADPYSYLGFCCGMLGSTGDLPPEIAIPKASEQAQKALEIDPELPHAHSVIALSKMLWEMDFTGAEAAYQKALELNPSDAEIHGWYAWFLMMVGREEEAIHEKELAAQLDPMSPRMHSELATAYSYVGRYEESFREYDRALEIAPDFLSVYEERGWARYLQGDLQGALEEFQRYHEMIGDPRKGLAPLGHTYAVLGDHEAAQNCLRQLDELREMEEGISLNLDYALINMGLGDLDAVFENLEKALGNRMGITYVLFHPVFEAVRKDPRFEDLVRIIGIDPDDLRRFMEVRKQDM